MYDHDDERLPCGHTEAEHEEMRRELSADFIRKADQGIDEVFDPKDDLRKEVARRSARIFAGLMNYDQSDPVDLHFTVVGTTPKEPLHLKCTVKDRNTGDIRDEWEVETLPGVVGNVELMMMLTACLATGLAEKEMREEISGHFSA